MALGILSPDGDLFAEPARARTNDPAESHAAAKKMNETGAAFSDRRLALGLIRNYPGSTVPELAQRHACPGEDVEALRQRIGRRVSELQRAGLIEPGAPRDGSRTWHPTWVTR